MSSAATFRTHDDAVVGFPAVPVSVGRHLFFIIIIIIEAAAAASFAVGLSVRLVGHRRRQAMTSCVTSSLNCCISIDGYANFFLYRKKLIMSHPGKIESHGMTLYEGSRIGLVGGYNFVSFKMQQ